MEKPPKEEVKSEALQSLEARAASGATWQIHADGIDEDVREAAEAWLNAGNGDVLAALLLVTERMIVISRHASRRMERGRLSVHPPIGAKP
ncbi:hypothetical protein [Phyllobacterium sophorae]|uniref:Uncharacterized protein n=1 Tax=Phyllobacterium sophorae TaxID=1520277 RepID=A0A2P7B362_9HYPH|nr:hypothetical protein [Phyllobacterium sophorae]PSH60905.1 hypothetical protein CU103_25415 [Phyllobacterium sophorae]